MALKCVIGGRDSESFVTVAEATVLAAGLPDGTTVWSTLTTAEKELRLKLAAQVMSYLPFRGKRLYRGQALTWPRSGFGNKVVPKAVKEAQVFIAISVIHRALANRGAVSDSVGPSVTSVSLGGLLSVSFGAGFQRGSALDAVTDSANFPAILGLSQYLTQIRGRVIPAEEDATELLSTTTTTSTTGTTTTSTTNSTTTTSTTI